MTQIFFICNMHNKVVYYVMFLHSRALLLKRQREEFWKYTAAYFPEKQSVLYFTQQCEIFCNSSEWQSDISELCLQQSDFFCKPSFEEEFVTANFFNRNFFMWKLCHRGRNFEYFSVLRKAVLLFWNSAKFQHGIGANPGYLKVK